MCGGCLVRHEKYQQHIQNIEEYDSNQFLKEMRESSDNLALLAKHSTEFVLRIEELMSRKNISADSICLLQNEIISTLETIKSKIIKSTILVE
jgi:hypothetical protein